MRELLCINIGQAGIQISNAIWELFCMEHGINPEGKMDSKSLLEDFYSCHSIFQENENSRYVPRTISIDLEPTVLDEIRTGTYRNLFAKSQLISSLEDSSCNFARGYYTIGKNHLEEFLNKLRQVAQQCDMLQGLVLIQSFGGGCGSGFTSLVMNHLSIEYSKINRIMMSILPSNRLSCSVVEPYNVILASRFCTQTTDLCFYHDNNSLYRLLLSNLEVSSPTFTNINRVLAQIFSSITISVRYENSLNNDLDQIATNLVPYPSLHYLIDFYSPMYSQLKGQLYPATTLQITKDVFRLENALLECDLYEEKFVSCCLQYRGNVHPVEINNSILKVKNKNVIKFVDWCPTGFKVGVNKRPPIAPKDSCIYNSDRSVLLICNNTGFHQKLDNLNTKFGLLFKKRSFVHWFIGEGMEEGEFTEAREEIVFLMEDYKCLINDDDDDDEEPKEVDGQAKVVQFTGDVEEIDNSLEEAFIDENQGREEEAEDVEEPINPNKDNQVDHIIEYVSAKPDERIHKDSQKTMHGIDENLELTEIVPPQLDEENIEQDDNDDNDDNDESETETETDVITGRTKIDTYTMKPPIQPKAGATLKADTKSKPIESASYTESTEFAHLKQLLNDSESSMTSVVTL